MSAPLVHIVTLNWNGLADTLECLESIDRLTYTNVKAIVVDNASDNNEADTIQNAFPDAIVLKQSENLGFCGGCNAGVKYALENNADFVMLLNNDTLVSPDLIQNLLDGIEGIENVGAVSPLIMYYPATDRIWFSKAEWLPERATFSLSPGDHEIEELQDKIPYPTQFACGCCLLAPANVFRSQGVLDERYFAFYDEAEWCARIRRNGFESYVVPSATIYHKVSRSTPSRVAAYLMARNRLLWMKENLPMRERWRSNRFFIKDVLGCLANLMHLTKEHNPRPYSRAVLLGYRDYFLRKFYKWDKAVEPKLFDP
jgi:GT2 family glycosyltransferase